ncbi:hypothetical protein GCM10027070_30750 [Barrientosiimonas humi]
MLVEEAGSGRNTVVEEAGSGRNTVVEEAGSVASGHIETLEAGLDTASFLGLLDQHGCGGLDTASFLGLLDQHGCGGLDTPRLAARLLDRLGWAFA